MQKFFPIPVSSIGNHAPLTTGSSPLLWKLLLLLGLCPLGLAGQNAAPPVTADTVLTGIQLMNVYELNLNAHSFNADFYLWFKWRGDKDPMNIEFVNAIDKWSFTQNNFYEEAITLPDGYFYNGMRIEGRFYHPFELGRFPLDEHQLDIQIENVDFPLDSLRYVVAPGATFIRRNLQLPGWNMGGLTTEHSTTTYPTNLGENPGQEMAYSNFIFRLSIARPLNYFLLKLLLPLLIVIVVSLGALYIHPSHADARISLPIGSLLAAIFLQQSYSAALPDVGYMVLMDKIYLVAFAVIAAVMWRVILASNHLTTLKKQADVPAIRRLDARLAMFFLVVLFLVLGGLVQWNR
ncbi:MAG: hypothetical protein DA408_16170 [Bacteroidetes bacterium]|nr:MAG: hypothetical protein C7N36_10370 [Bacteroidota bacterium]PTM10384.1 MAG: hypothetical protein DA408_16170 [Bacteroidota bacterium]